ncbi:MarR family winged helix-turn-helix transcriptional regulator [Blastococcus montanus]|uniref:MarR family winged helix-turn-helix transcriptional regulator n=1 Tax=Blastococcus montanus TaxID=3144973 RepID=UPI00320A61BF
MAQEQRPVGWWVKRLDALLEEAVDAAVAPEGLTRRHWQVLHSLAEGDAGPRDVLRDFSVDVGPVVADLTARGWVTRPAAGALRLTEDGAAAHDRVWRAVGRVRRHAADGMSRDEYERAVTVLARMVENMERALGRG